MRIDGVDRVSFLFEGPVGQVAAGLTPIGDADDGDLLLSEEFPDQRVDISHANLPFPF
ncbi:hypothetical protein D3C83_239530 [compost metagenome]